MAVDETSLSLVEALQYGLLCNILLLDAMVEYRSPYPLDFGDQRLRPLAARR